MIQYSLENSIGTILLAQNEKNSFSKVDFLTLQSILLEIQKNTPNLLVLKSGTPDIFSAGLNLADLGGSQTEDSVKEFLELFYGNLELIYTMTCPTIAAVSGHALGYGAMLALVCDIRLGMNNIRFGLPEVKLGIRVPAFVYSLLGDAIGNQRATEHVTFGDAEKAKDISSVFYSLSETKEEFEKALKSTITKLTKNSSQAMVETKKAILLTKKPLLDLLALDKDLTRKSLNSSHAKEGIAAAQAGRRPNFT